MPFRVVSMPFGRLLIGQVKLTLSPNSASMPGLCVESWMLLFSSQDEDD